MKRGQSILLLSLLILVGCLKTRAELAAEESETTQRRQTVAQQRVAANDSMPAKEKAPPAAYRFEEYDEQLRQLTGRVDALENMLAQLNAAKQSDQSTVGKEKQAAEQKFLAYEDALKKLEAQVASLTEEVTRLKAPPPEPPTAAPSAASKSNPKISYDSGEDAFAAKKWKDAIVSYQKYRDLAPKGKLYPDATYKIGVCFQELGLKDEARAFLEEVVSKFPNSKEAKKAAVRIKSLK